MLVRSLLTSLLISAASLQVSTALPASVHDLPLWHLPAPGSAATHRHRCHSLSAARHRHHRSQPKRPEISPAARGHARAHRLRHQPVRGRPHPAPQQHPLAAAPRPGPSQDVAPPPLGPDGAPHAHKLDAPPRGPPCETRLKIVWGATALWPAQGEADSVLILPLGRVVTPDIVPSLPRHPSRMELASVLQKSTEDDDEEWTATEPSDRLVCSLELQDGRPFQSSEEEMLGRQQMRLRMADGLVSFDKVETKEYLGDRSVVGFGCYELPS